MNDPQHTPGDTLVGTVAIVTGASSGIGQATARALASRGASLTVAARRVDRLEVLSKEISDNGGQALVLETDVTDEAQANEMVQRTLDEYGRLDTLVNNAGVMLLGPILGAPTEEWRRMVHLNLLGLLYCTHAALPNLLEAADSGRRRVADVVNVSSVAGRVARLGSAVYNATKWGVNAFSESLRQEVTRQHVRVTIVEPGATITELATHLRPEILQQQAATFAAVELLKAEDIADAITYAVTRPRHIALNELLVRPTEQER
jgi:NADP-dependent 3-hydroxy acid dehydrogenase YdfG